MISKKAYLMHTINNASDELVEILSNYVQECAPFTWSLGVKEAIQISKKNYEVKNDT